MKTNDPTQRAYLKIMNSHTYRTAIKDSIELLNEYNTVCRGGALKHREIVAAARAFVFTPYERGS